MAGRWIRRWSISGCLVLGAVGCNKNSVQTSDAQPVMGMTMTAPAGKSLWGNSQTPTSNEVVMDEPKKGPAKPETFVAFADVRMAMALDEKTPETGRAAILDQARHGYQSALQQDPKNKAALLGMARYYSRVGERERTLEYYQKYLGLYPGDREVTYEVARVYARWQDWNNAVHWCDLALKIDPENLTFRKTKGFCLACSGHWDEAYAVFIKLMPEAQARYTIARVLEDQNFVDASRQQLQAALQLDPNFNDARLLLAELENSAQPINGTVDPATVQRAGYVQQP